MKTEVTNRLTCERARAFLIEKALAKLGHFPTRTNEKEAWFMSPLRSETQTWGHLSCGHSVDAVPVISKYQIPTRQIRGS